MSLLLRLVVVLVIAVPVLSVASMLLFRMLRRPGMPQKIQSSGWLSALVYLAIPPVQADVRRLLVRSGPHPRLSWETLMRVRWVAGLTGALVGATVASGAGLLWPWVVVCGLAGLGIGLELPLLWLRDRSAANKHSIVRRLPEALDLLATALEGGLVIDQALERVGTSLGGPIGDQLTLSASELRLSVSRTAALERLGNRAGVDDMQRLVYALMEAQHLGVKVADALREQARQLRRHNMLQVRSQAARASLFMFVPMAFLMMPAIFVVILGPTLFVLVR